MDYNVVILGIVISILFYEITNITPGGIVVPGLLAIYINQIDRIIYTVVIAIITYYIIKLLSKFFVIFGKRRLALAIFISIGLSLLLDLILHSISFDLLAVRIIGYSIAGIIANTMVRQGVVKTVPALAIVLGLVEVIAIIVNQIGF